MRKIIAILIVVLLLATAFGCSTPGKTTTTKPGSEKTDTTTDTTKDTTTKTTTGKYAGFMAWKAGMWSETKITQGGQSSTMRQEIVESSPTLAKFQTSMEQGGQKIISQMWLNPSTYKATKYVVKTGSQVMCMDVSNAANMPTNPSDYPADKPDMKLGTYTTPTGKTLAVAKYVTSDGETWVSSEVPFGAVKVVSGGKTTMELQDFGNVGAKSLISDSEISNCQDLSAMAKAASNVNTEVYSNTGTPAGISCSSCNSMPAAAKSACLAACK